MTILSSSKVFVKNLSVFDVCGLQSVFDVGINIAILNEADSFRVSEFVCCCCFIKLRLDV